MKKTTTSATKTVAAANITTTTTTTKESTVNTKSSRKDINVQIAGKIVLTGRIARMSQEWSKNARGYTKTTLAVSGTGKGKDNERWNATKFFKTICWDRLGQALFDNADTGDAIWIVGVPQQFQVEIDGKIVTKSNINITDWGFLSGGRVRKDLNVMLEGTSVMTGRIARMSEEFSENGDGYTRFALAVESTGRDENGERWTQTKFYRMICWGKLGERLFDCAEVGDAIWITGNAGFFNVADTATGEITVKSNVTVTDWGFQAAQPKA